MSKSSTTQLRREFDLPTGVAAWVVLTHLFVLASPLALLWATYEYAEQLPQPMANPAMVLFATAIYICATAFEVAQNSADRWYLIEATRSVADLLFNALLTIAFCCYAIGFGANMWLIGIAVLACVIYPFAYAIDHPLFRGINGVVLLIACFSLYELTDDPTSFLFLLGNGLGVYSILYLFKRRAQWIHGLAALLFGIGFLAWPAAIVNAATNSTMSWLAAGGIVLAGIVLAAAFTPVMSNSKPTPRQFG